MTRKSDSASNGQGAARRAMLRALSVIEETRERSRLRHELGALREHGELDRVLEDVHLSAADIGLMLANHPASSHLLTDMVARLDVSDELGKDWAMERDMQRNCTLCETQGRCKHWMASGATEGYAEFCPNADRLHVMSAVRGVILAD